MYIEYKCLECGKVFSADKEQVEYAKNSVGTQAKKHIREFHKMDIKDYVVKHYFNGITPKIMLNFSLYELNDFSPPSLKKSVSHRSKS